MRRSRPLAHRSTWRRRWWERWLPAELGCLPASPARKEPSRGPPLRPSPRSTAPAEVVLTGDRRHYLLHVLRLAEGATLEVFDGTGRSFDARVTRVERAGGPPLAGARAERASPPRGERAAGAAQGRQARVVLQKGTELGAAAFYPVATARSVVKLEPKRAEERTARWTKIVEEAARQCRRNDVPRVHTPRPLLEAARALAPGTALLVLDEEETAVPLGRGLPRLCSRSPRGAGRRTRGRARARRGRRARWPGCTRRHAWAHSSSARRRRRWPRSP